MRISSIKEYLVYFFFQIKNLIVFINNLFRPSNVNYERAPAASKIKTGGRTVGPSNYGYWNMPVYTYRYEPFHPFYRAYYPAVTYGYIRYF